MASPKFKFTNLNKIMFPEAKLTKGDLVDYYRQIAPRMLPFLKNRPLTVERLPDGLTSESAPRFWQKNTPDYYPKWIKRITLDTQKNRPVQYVLANDLDSLLYLVNQGCIAFHIYESRVKKLEHPDFVLFDLDPGDGAISDLVKVANVVRKLLQADKAKAFIKTSGKRGLHILSPWKKRTGYDEARNWATNIAERAADELSTIATLERSIAARKGKLYIDVIQNALGHHVVAPYTLRAVPRATVSTPLDWTEVTPKLKLNNFTTTAVLSRKPLPDWGQGIC